MSKASAKISPLIPVLLGILVLVSGYLVYQNLEWIEYERDLGPTEEARRNPFLAAAELMELYQVELSNKRSFRDFDQPMQFLSDSQPADTIVLVDAYGSLSANRMGHLLAWVDQGGHLIATAKNPFLDNADNIGDPLFEFFNVAIERQGEDAMTEELWDIVSRYGYLAGVSGEELCPLLFAQNTFNFDGDETQLGVHFLSEDRLIATDAEPSGWIGDSDWAHLLQFDYGEGLVTLVSSLDLWKNSAIGCLDHAYVLWQLGPDSGPMVFYTNMEFPSFVSLLWRYFDLSVILFLGLLGAWLWYRGARLGPIRHAETASQRQLLEHIDASANFLWRIGKLEVSVERARQQVLVQLQRKYPQVLKPVSISDEKITFRLEDRAEQTRFLSKQLGIQASHIDLALWRPINNDPQRLVATLRDLQRLKERI